MDELPNGFTGFARRADGFVSAGEASRMSRGISSAPVSGKAGRNARVAGAVGRSARSDGTADPSRSESFDLEALDGIPEADRRWAWAQVDLSAIRHNVAETRRFLQPRCRLMAVVEADAYGHGAAEVSKAVLGAGADRLAVATVSEAVALRKAGITVPILLLAQPPEASIPLLVGYAITPSVYDTQFAVSYGEEADRHGLKAPYHLLLNTGMNDLGIRYDEAVEFLYMVSFHRALELEGVFTQFATADCPETLDFRMQTKRFAEAVEAIRAAGFEVELVHAANSAAIYRYPEVHFDMVRMGVSLYGLHPCPETRTVVDLRPAMSVHARIVDVRMPVVSEGVSFGLRYRSPGSVKICTLPLGFADGLRFELSGNTDFIMGGRYWRQVGEICMDHCMFEVDMRRSPARAFVDPQVGDEVLVVGSQDIAEVTMDEMAEKIGTRNHEIALGFGMRLPRVYA